VFIFYLYFFHNGFKKKIFASCFFFGGGAGNGRSALLYFGENLGVNVSKIGVCGYGYIPGYPRIICGYEYGYGWKISYPRQACKYTRREPFALRMKRLPGKSHPKKDIIRTASPRHDVTVLHYNLYLSLWGVYTIQQWLLLDRVNILLHSPSRERETW